MVFTAAFDITSNGYMICESDADGMSNARLRISGADTKLAADVSRLALLALNMEGGVTRATELLRAAVVRQDV